MPEPVIRPMPIPERFCVDISSGSAQVNGYQSCAAAIIAGGTSCQRLSPSCLQIVTALPAPEDLDTRASPEGTDAAEIVNINQPVTSSTSSPRRNGAFSASGRKPGKRIHSGLTTVKNCVAQKLQRSQPWRLRTARPAAITIVTGLRRSKIKRWPNKVIEQTGAPRSGRPALFHR